MAAVCCRVHHGRCVLQRASGAAAPPVMPSLAALNPHQPPPCRRSTNLSNPESETLLDEGLKLWSVALSSGTTVPEPLVQLLPQVGRPPHTVPRC
jgi:hypothetical protein